MLITFYDNDNAGHVLWGLWPGSTDDIIIAKYGAIINSSTRCLLSSKILDENKDRVLKNLKLIYFKQSFKVKILVHDLCFRRRSSLKAKIMYRKDDVIVGWCHVGMRSCRDDVIPKLMSCRGFRYTMFAFVQDLRWKQRSCTEFFMLYQFDVVTILK